MLEHLKIIKPSLFLLFFCNKLKAWEISSEDTNIKKSFGKRLFSSLASLAWGELWKGHKNLSHERPLFKPGGVNLWIWGTVMLAWQGQEGRLWECCLFFASWVVPPPHLYQVHKCLCSRRHLSVCLSLISKEFKSFPRDLSWTAARRDDISCCAALGRDRSTPSVPGHLKLPASLDPQVPVPEHGQTLPSRSGGGSRFHTLPSQHTTHRSQHQPWHIPLHQEKWEMQDRQQRRHSKLTFGILPAHHGAHLQGPEFKKPSVSVCTIISSDNKAPPVLVYVLCVRGTCADSASWCF